jgi:hypothetical protein
MPWVNLQEDILELFSETAPTVPELVRNPRTGEITARGLWTTTAPQTKKLRDAAWKAAHPKRVLEHQANYRATHKKKSTGNPVGRPKKGPRFCFCGKETFGRALCGTHRSQKSRSR